MSKGWQYKPGDWYICCDVCGKQIYASESRNRWDGFIVCKDDWEPRHPQDFLRARMDKISVPFSRPEPEDRFNHVEGLNDFLVLSGEPVTERGYIREIDSDSVSILDTVSFVSSFSSSQTDSFVLADSVTFLSTGKLTLGDNFSVSGSGYFFNNDYIDPTYFETESQYIGTLTTFT